MVCLYDILVSSFHIHEVITDFDLKGFEYLKNFKYFDHNQGRFPQNTHKKIQTILLRLHKAYREKHTFILYCVTYFNMPTIFSHT